MAVWYHRRQHRLRLAFTIHPATDYITTSADLRHSVQASVIIEGQIQRRVGS